MIEHGEAGSCKTRHRFKEGTRYGRDFTAHQEWKHAQNGEHQPSEGYDTIAVAACHPGFGTFAVSRQSSSGNQVDTRGVQKIFVAVFAVQQGDTHTNEEHAALHPKQDADYVGNEFGVDNIVERCVAVVFLGLKVVSRLAHIR